MYQHPTATESLLYKRFSGKCGEIWEIYPLRAPNHCGGAESLRGAPKSPNNVTSTFFNNRSPSERPQVRTWERQTCLLPRAPSNLVTLLLAPQKFTRSYICALLIDSRRYELAL